MCILCLRVSSLHSFADVGSLDEEEPSLSLVERRVETACFFPTSTVSSTFLELLRMNSLSRTYQHEGNTRKDPQDLLYQGLPHAQTVYGDELCVNLLFGNGLLRGLDGMVLRIEHGAHCVRGLELRHAPMRGRRAVVECLLQQRDRFSLSLSSIRGTRHHW